MAYSKTVYVNNTTPAISADNLNKVENELEYLDNTIPVIYNDVADIENNIQKYPTFVGTDTAETSNENLILLSGLTCKANTLYKLHFTMSNTIDVALPVYIEEVGDTTTRLKRIEIPVGKSSMITYLATTSAYSNVRIRCRVATNVQYTATARWCEFVNGSFPVKNKINLKQINETGQYIYDEDFIWGYIDGTGTLRNSDTRICTPYMFTATEDTNIAIEDGYRIGIVQYSGGSYFDSGWKQGHWIILKGTQYFITISNYPEASSTVDIETLKNAVKINSYSKKELDRCVSVPMFPNGRYFKRYFSHLDVNKYDNVIIPSQSIFDVMKAKRLGFDVLELNVHKTSDNKYICLHGSDNKFGAAFIGINGEDVSNYVISDMTLSQIQSSIRFKSIYAKYKVAPSTLEEILYECKYNNIIPFCSYVDDAELTLLDKIMGKNNYFIGIYSQLRGFNNNSPLLSWYAEADTDLLLQRTKASGGMFVLGINASNSTFDNYTDADWKELFNKIHKEGYYISTSYLTEGLKQRLLKCGLDIILAQYEINDIESGNICNLIADMDYSDFSHNGIVSDGILSLSNGNTIAPRTELASVFLGGANLHIRFNGTITLVFGNSISENFTSDGKNEMQFNTNFQESIPTFLITSVGATQVYDISFKASKM